MVGGQAFDLASEGNTSIGREGLELLHYSKTGIIFKAAIELAAVLGDAGEAQKKALDTYAFYMGLTFQITDDILDVVGDEASLGKPVGSDAKNDKATYVTIFSLDEARRMAEEAAEKATAAVERWDRRLGSCGTSCRICSSVRSKERKVCSKKNGSTCCSSNEAGGKPGKGKGCYYGRPRIR